MSLWLSALNSHVVTSHESLKRIEFIIGLVGAQLCCSSTVWPPKITELLTARYAQYAVRYTRWRNWRTGLYVVWWRCFNTDNNIKSGGTTQIHGMQHSVFTHCISCPWSKGESLEVLEVQNVTKHLSFLKACFRKSNSDGDHQIFSLFNARPDGPCSLRRFL